MFEDFAEHLVTILDENAGAPLLFVIAGHNGAGKTTCYNTFLKLAVDQILEPDRMPHINPDDLEKEFRAQWEEAGAPVVSDETFSKHAQAYGNRERSRYLESDRHFSFETVFSDPVGDKVSFLEKAKERGYVVALLGIGLESANKSIARVALRVSRSGHDVPESKLRERYPRVFKNFGQGAKVASLALFVDNSTDNEAGVAYKPFRMFMDGELIAEDSDNTPEWWNLVEASMTSQ